MIDTEGPCIADYQTPDFWDQIDKAKNRGMCCELCGRVVKMGRGFEALLADCSTFIPWEAIGEDGVGVVKIGPTCGTKHHDLVPFLRKVGTKRKSS